MNARRVAKELEYHTKGLNRNLPAVPPTLTKEETKQVELWKRFITYEKSNPLRTEDTALVTRRVMFATEQCLLVLTHHPAVWHQASQFLDTSARVLTEKGVRSRRSHTQKQHRQLKLLLLLPSFANRESNQCQAKNSKFLSLFVVLL